MLRIGQVFWCVNRLLVCVRVNDCSARVIETTMKQVEDPAHVYDEFDRYGYRITSCPEIEPGKQVCYLPKDRIKIHESTFTSINRAPLGVVEIPIIDRSKPMPRKPKAKKVDVTVVEDEQVTILEVLEMSARISTGIIRNSLRGSRP